MNNRNLLDPALEEVLESIEPSDEIEVAVRLKNPNDVPEKLRVISSFGDVITCRIQAGLVRKVRSSPSIISVKYNRPLALGFDPRADIESAYEELTLSNSYNDVYRIPRESGGEGVLIAFLDWGIAYAEKAFLDENNETRFHAIWYQGADYSSEKPNKYGYGRIFLKDEINASLKTDDPYSFLGYHPAKADPLGIGSHGTHVCDIAAGSRRKIQNGYIQGIANKSGLIFVDLKADDTKGLSSLSSSIKVLEALDFVSNIAGNRPLVVNISAGSHGGPHDDSSLVVRAIDNLVSMNLGRIVCMSTGNYKMNQTHTEGIVKSGREKQFNWIIHETNMSDKELEIWYPGSDIFLLGIVLPGSKKILFTQLGEKKSITLNGVEIGKSYHRKDPLNNDHHIDIFIYKGAPVGKWKIVLYGNDVIDGRYYAWIERDIDPRYQSKFEKKDSVINSTIGSICTGRQSIVVGAFDSRTSERKLAEFSSRGPTRNGIDKPDICAPGVEIIAAKSTPLNSKPPTSLLVSKSGVSMATPYVSGTVALLVSASKKMLTISEIRRILLGGADKCSVDNSCCGYGYLNIDAALGRVLDLTGQEYLIKENVFSGQEDDQDINYSSKVENFHPLQINGSAISDSKFIGKMLNNSEHADGHNELNRILEDETEAQTNSVTAHRDGSNIIKIVDDYIALSQGNTSHSVLLNHVLSEIRAFNIQNNFYFRGNSQLFFNNNFTPEMIYDIFTLPQYRYSRIHYHDVFEVVARPGTKISGKLNSGNILIRNMDINYCHLAFIVSPEMMTFGDLVRNNFTAERSNQKEGYVHVVEGKPRHRVIDRFARIICDNYGVVPDNQLVVGIKLRGTSDPSINLSDSLSTYDYDRFADPSLFQEGPIENLTPQQKFEASLKPTLVLNTVITRAREIISRLNVSGKPNENKKRRIINIYNCLLNKVQDPNVRDFYIAYPEYVHYRHITYGGASQSDLMKEGFIDASGNWIKFRYVRDFLRKPVYFDYNKTDGDYLKSLALLYNEIDETMTNIRQYLEQREAGGQAGRIQQLALLISKEGNNKHSIYSCWDGVSSSEESLSLGSEPYLDTPISSSFNLLETASSSPLLSRLNYDSLTRQIHDAISGAGTDEIKIYLALQRLERDSTVIANLDKEYARKYNKSLLTALKGDLRGSELEFALQLINRGNVGAKEEIKPHPNVDGEWWQAADRLSEAFTGAGTKEEVIYAVLLPFKRNPSAIFNLNEQFYKRKYGEDLRDRISSELLGKEKNYALYLLGEQPILNDDAKSIKLAQDVLAYVKTEANNKAKDINSVSVSPSSKFYNVLKTRYLNDYLSNPTATEGIKTIEKIGRKMETRFNSVSRQVEVKTPVGTWRPARDSWEANSHLVWNNQQLPALPQEVKDLPIFRYIKGLQSRLGTSLAAATDILKQENVADLPYLDIPFLVGDPNPGTGTFWIDVVGGGKNVSQLMHWATGVRYSAESKLALQEVFLLYEMWHLEAWDVFGQDPINDMISEEHGRILGAELLKGSSGSIKSETDLIAFLNKSFIEARAWIGALLRLRQPELDNWILAKQHKPASMHWGAIGNWHVWASLTVYQMLADGLTLEEVKKSYMVKAEVEIYALIYEAERWEKTNGPINITALQKALVQGKLNKILKVLAKGGKSSTKEMLDAKSAIDDLKKL